MTRMAMLTQFFASGGTQRVQTSEVLLGQGNQIVT